MAADTPVVYRNLTPDDMMLVDAVRVDAITFVFPDATGIPGVPAGYILQSWNTARDGSGTSYAIGDVIDISEGYHYAIWTHEIQHPNLLDESGLRTLCKLIRGRLSRKQDKETGKGLSTNDLTNAEKSKLVNMQPLATTDSPTFENLTVNGYIDNAKFL